MDEKRALESSIPYHNQKADIHSSFYYYVIYTASSLVPEAFSKQVGIVPNFLFYLLATVLLFLLSWCISGSPILGVAATMCGAMAHPDIRHVDSLLLAPVHLRTLREAKETGH